MESVGLRKEAMIDEMRCKRKIQRKAFQWLQVVGWNIAEGDDRNRMCHLRRPSISAVWTLSIYQIMRYISQTRGLAKNGRPYTPSLTLVQPQMAIDKYAAYKTNTDTFTTRVFNMSAHESRKNVIDLGVGRRSRTMLPPVQNHRNKQPRSPTTQVAIKTSIFALFSIQYTVGKGCLSYRREDLSAKFISKRCTVEDSRSIEKFVSRLGQFGRGAFCILILK